MDGGDGYVSGEQSRLGCGKALCRLNEPPLKPSSETDEVSSCDDGMLRCEGQCVSVRSNAV